MKILVMLTAILFGFGFVLEDTTKPIAPVTVTEVAYEEPVMTVLLDTVEVVYEAPAAIAATTR